MRSTLSLCRWILSSSLALLATSCGGETPGSPTCDGDCATPPAAVCEGDRAISFSLFGECSNGQCVYPPVVDDCAADGGTCVAGACVAPPDPCDGVVCDQPPATNCEGDTLNQYAADSGECVDGGCTYEVQQTDCAARRQVCEDGACVTPVNLCAGILCEDPPANGCDGESAVTYVDEGECNPEDGECVYAEVTRRDCAAEGLFCNNGRCQAENPCAGITCDSPPTNFCNDNDNAVVYVARGTCSGGECSYLESVRDCDDATEVCEDGACRDRLPCDGVVCNRPPAATCRGTLRNFYEPLGTCTDGICSYVLRSQECAATDQICQGGACVNPDACFGVVCNSIPATVCRGNTVVSYRAGSCQLPGGSCSYPEVTLDCTASGRTCVDGACEITDPCAGVICLTPPAPECLDGVAVEYLAPGECNPATGLCEYDPAVDDCAAVPGFACAAGVCEFVDPCLTAECETPAFFCDGEVAVSYTDGGVCLSDGSCDTSLSEVREDCTESGSTCFEGTCRGPGAFVAPDAFWITEIFPGDDIARRTPWFEIRNTSRDPLPLSGMRVVSGAEGELEWTIPAGVTIEGLQYLVFAPAGYTIPGAENVVRFPVDAVRLPQAGGRVQLVSLEGSTESVVYDSSWPYTSAVSAQLDPGASFAELTSSVSWCASGIEGEESGFTSPGASNHGCAARWATQTLTITELLPEGNPLPFGDESWFEVQNGSFERPLNLDGVQVVAGEAFLIQTPAFIEPFGYFVLSQQTANLSGRNNYGDNRIQVPTAGSIELRVPGRTIVTLTYDTGLPFSTGVSAQWEVDRVLSETAIPEDWCAPTTSYGGFVSNLGTPGRFNDCPADPIEGSGAGE